jgi:hypothetical protein
MVSNNPDYNVVYYSSSKPPMLLDPFRRGFSSACRWTFPFQQEQRCAVLEAAISTKVGIFTLNRVKLLVESIESANRSVFFSLPCTDCVH